MSTEVFESVAAIDEKKGVTREALLELDGAITASPAARKLFMELVLRLAAARFQVLADETLQELFVKPLIATSVAEGKRRFLAACALVPGAGRVHRSRAYTVPFRGGAFDMQAFPATAYPSNNPRPIPRNGLSL